MAALPAKITVLVFASNPHDQDLERLRLEEEVRDITETIRLSKHRDRVELCSCWAVRPRDLLQQINERQPMIVHFSAHGSDAGDLVMQDDQGNPHHVAKGAIVQVIKAVQMATAGAGTGIRLAVFNACHSRDLAEAVVQHIDAAIGMNAAIGDEAACVFAAQLYSSIGFGHALAPAFEQAKAAVMVHGLREEETPELFVRAGVSAAGIFLVAADETVHDVGNASVRPDGARADARDGGSDEVAAAESIHGDRRRRERRAQVAEQSLRVVFRYTDGLKQLAFGTTFGSSDKALADPVLTLNNQWAFFGQLDQELFEAKDLAEIHVGRFAADFMEDLLKYRNRLHRNQQGFISDRLMFEHAYGESVELKIAALRQRGIELLQPSATDPGGQLRKQFLDMDGTHREPAVADKYVSTNYIVKAGLDKKLDSEGYNLYWASAHEEQERVDFEGWTHVEIPDQDGSSARLKVQDSIVCGGYLVLLKRKRT